MTEVFDAYASYYDLLYADKEYEAEAEYVAGLIRSHAISARSVLEFGCGTGGHAEHLARLGFDVLGIDLSEAMLASANKRRAALPSEEADRLAFVKGDLRDHRVGTQFDVVISLFHVFSYQTTNEDLLAAFDTCAAHLRPGGLLIFDFWYGPAVLRQLPATRIRRLANDEVSVLRIAEPDLDSARNQVDVNYTVQIDAKADGVQHEVTECHKMRYLFLPEIELLAAPDFRVISQRAWMADRDPSMEDWAAVCVLERQTGKESGVEL